MKRIRTFYLFILMGFSVQIWSQEIVINDNFRLIRLTDKVFMHTSNRNNRVVYFNEGDCMIVSTLASNELTSELGNLLLTSMTWLARWILRAC